MLMHGPRGNCTIMQSRDASHEARSRSQAHKGSWNSVSDTTSGSCRYQKVRRRSFSRLWCFCHSRFLFRRKSSEQHRSESIALISCVSSSHGWCGGRSSSDVKHWSEPRRTWRLLAADKEKLLCSAIFLRVYGRAWPEFAPCGSRRRWKNYFLIAAPQRVQIFFHNFNHDALPHQSEDERDDDAGQLASNLNKFQANLGINLDSRETSAPAGCPRGQTIWLPMPHKTSRHRPGSGLQKQEKCAYTILEIFVLTPGPLSGMINLRRPFSCHFCYLSPTPEIYLPSESRYRKAIWIHHSAM